MKKHFSCKIKINLEKTIMSSFVVFILFRIPRSILNMPLLYQIKYSTRLYRDQGELFGITIFDVIVVLLGLLLSFSKNKRRNKYWIIALTVIAINLFRFLLGLTNPIMYNSYEIILSLIVSFSCGIIVLYYYRTADDISFFINVVIAGIFTTQLYMILSHQNQGGSYGCLGLPSGGVAMCYSTYILIKIVSRFKRKSDIVLTIVSLIGIVFTGSRVNLIMLLAFIVFYVIFSHRYNNKQKWLFAIALLICGFILYFLQNILTVIITSRKINSLLSIFDSGLYSYVTEDASALERYNSWKFGIEVIKENLLGISCSIVDLQNRMYEKGSVTFPHSQLIAYYLLLGIPSLFIYCSFWKTLIQSRKVRAGVTLMLSFLVLKMTLYGGVATTYLSIFWQLILYEYANSVIRNTDSSDNPNKSSRLQLSTNI